MKDLLQQADRIPVTLVLIIAYVTLFALTNMYGPDQSHDEMLQTYGILRPAYAADGEPWRLITAAFLHFNLIHIAMNLWFLIAIGPALEQSLGSVRFVMLYLVSAIGGHIAVCLLYPVLGGVLGGSGALFGMMGSLLAINMRSGRHLFSFLDFEGPRRLIGMILVNLVIGWLLPVVSNTGHIGGLIAGFLVTFLWLEPGRAPTRTLFRYRLGFTALFATLLFWSIQPATRFDHLLLTGNETRGEHGAAMRRAAAMSLLGQPTATDADADQMIPLIERLREGR